MPRSIFIIILIVFFSFPVGTAQGRDENENTTLDISITGIEDPLLANVRASLSLLSSPTGKHLTDAMVDKLYEQADDEIKKALEPYGYYSPSIQKKIRRENDVRHVAIHIDPGEPVRITGVDIRLTGPGRDDANLREEIFRAAFPLKAGDVLDHQLYEQGKKFVSTTAIASGYRDVFFKENTIRVNRREFTAAIRIIIDTGPQYLFGSTHFDADFISSDLLHRMLTYREGEPYSPRKIIQIRRALLNSDYFSAVDVKTMDADPPSLKIPVAISLKPKNPNKFGIGVGYGTDTGFRGSLEWTNRLLNRYGHQFNMLLQPSERKTNFGMSYTIPVNDPRKDRISLVGRWEKENFETTESESRNVTVSYDHIGDKGEYSFYTRYLDEDYEIGSEKGHATFLHPGVRTIWRWTEDRLKTKNGLRIALDLTGATNEIISDASFAQVSVNAKGIVSFLEAWRFIGRFQFGWTHVDTVFDLSPSLRFYAGGDQSVRGFAYKSIGPTDPEGDVVGASHLITYSAELERTLFGNWSGAVFFDSGDATNALSDLYMHNGIGAGIRWNAPFGQVRLDVAKGFGVDGEGSWRIHFNVGADL